MDTQNKSISSNTTNRKGPMPMTSKAREPTHPGTILRLDVLPALNRSVTEMATDLGVTRQMLHRIMSKKASVTAEMALRLGKYCGNGPDLWLDLQRQYDLWHAQRKLRSQVTRIRTVHGRSACNAPKQKPAATDLPTQSMPSNPTRSAAHRHSGRQ